MNHNAIKVQNLNKIYRSISDTGTWPAVSVQYIQALKNLNFEVSRGELLGLCGHNGAGKSTLLKILSRIIAPSSGLISGKGRIYSLLELGSGFHRDLSGIENIYLNAAMLGMHSREISKQLKAICGFANLNASLNTPVKQYSSGMLMRLAFATAMHLPAEILLLDEALAVGDSDFQQMGLQKIRELHLKGEKTIILVSHDERHINQLCDRKLTLINGELER